MTNNTDYRIITAARARLTELTTNSPDLIRATEPPYYSTAADLANEMLRDLLIADDDDRLADAIDRDYYRDESPTSLDPTISLDILAMLDELISLLDIIRTDPYSIHFLSQLRLDHSLCPMHHCDYAACFDDDDPECATIRAYFPDHDT